MTGLQRGRSVTVCNIGHHSPGCTVSCTKTPQYKLSVICTFVPCVLVLSKFFYSPTNAQVIVLKTILKFTFTQLRHISVQAHHLQGPHYSCWPKLHFVKIVDYGTLVSTKIHPPEIF